MTTRPDELVGTLISVAASWLRTEEGERVPEPIHVWVTLEGLGTRKLHTPGSGSVAILEELPHQPYSLDDLGRVEVVEGTPHVLSDRVGQRIQATSELRQEPPGEQVGFILHFADGDVGVANLADDLTIEPWPSAEWTRWGVARMGE